MFQGFDPLLFLDISDVKKDEKHKLTEELLIQISNYLAIRFIEILPRESTQNIQTFEELFLASQKNFPDFNEKIKLFLGDFKKEYKKT